ncbi:nudix hydrolase 9 isoform X2 [Panicum miliaceum]|uniref:Nudix hydrolase 9 isoform X2 n=1 Tax=Panicum miliaceum TaxID=4540 RepID=A0A3L6RCW6_PANMI|nr:nudix hydrolase 9 isoform X2 [Panicum miliaceum]
MAATASAADPGTAFKLLLSCPAGLPRSRVSVKFGQSFDRIPHPDAALEESRSEIWNQRLQRNPSLYNGTKFRYGGHAVHYKDDSKKEFRRSSVSHFIWVSQTTGHLWEQISIHCGRIFWSHLKMILYVANTCQIHWAMVQLLKHLIK